jgi:hypothetical protein
MMNTGLNDDLPEADGGGTARDPMADQAARLEAVRAPDIEDDGEAAPDDLRQVDDEGQVIGGAPELIGKDAFWTVWQNSFAMPGWFSPRWKPLAIQPDEIEPGRAASDAAYEILEIYMPSALTPQGEMIQRLAVLVPFIFAKAQIARGILAEMKAERASRVSGTAANTNAAPEFRTRRTANRDSAPGAYDWLDEEQGAA